MNPPAVDLKIGGLARISSCDWPGELAATIFCQGCAWSCPYCHNPGLRPSNGEPLLDWSDVQEFLRSRRGLLDAVVFSGGEPLLQCALCDAAEQLRGLGFRIGLHTTGMLPDRFARVLPLIDWVGFDVKAPFESYGRITGLPHSGDAALESLRLLLASGVEYEVRTTMHSTLLSLADMQTIKASLLEVGVSRFVVQHYRAHPTHGPALALSERSELPLGYAQGFQHFEIRG